MKWITATNLEQWAETLQARTVFPGLVADLIRASASEISAIRFPNGDKGQVRGFDGVLEAVGVSPYVPDGNSIWEFGVTGDVVGKADGDYTKRTKEVDAAVRANTTFVFVTPRTWDNPKKKIADWLKVKRDLGEWKGVEYFDGVAVEEWLSAHPAVASRYARYELKLMPQLGAYSTDEFWQEYSCRFAPALVEDVLLAGRESQAKGLIQQLLDGSSTLPFAADSPDEVIAFAVAAIRRADTPVRLYLEARALIIDTEDAGRQLSNKNGLIFLPCGQARRLAGLLAQSGPTIVSAGADEQRRGHELLSRPSSSAMGKAIELMGGYTAEQAYELARKCGRSLAVLARQIPSATAEPPEWMLHAQGLLPALLAGAWKASTASDKTILQAIGGSNTYEAIEAPLRPLTKLKDPPLDRIDDVWSMRAPIDAFVNLAHLLGEEHLSRFATAATEVFSKIAPEPKADEVFRPAAAREDTYSTWLREGMMTTLLHMAVLHEQADFSIAGTTPQEFVNDIVRKLPGLSNNYRLMASLQDNLALLAEAAPIPFLDALERLLEGDAAAIKPIFEEQKGFLTSHSRHVGLLWALEVLAWDPHYLLRAATCLARLAAIDPGGSISNRPINSLREIFLTWSPNTRAPVKQRLSVLNHVLKTVPDISWELLVALLPKHFDSSSPTAKPKFRESEGASTEELTYGVVWESQAFIIDLALKEARSPQRWEKLVGTMDQFPPEPFERTLTALDEFLGNHGREARHPVWDTLRKEANRHRAFPNAEWAYKEGALAKIDALIAKYKPADPLLVSTWLFDDWLPDMPQKTDSTEVFMEAVEQARVEALREILNKNGVLKVVELAKNAKLPQLVASALSKLELPEDVLAELLHRVIGAGEDLVPLAASIVTDGFVRNGADWLNIVGAIAEYFNLESAKLARLLSGIPENRMSWNLIADFGESVDDAYWKEKHAFGISGPTEDLLFATEKYRMHGRPLAAIQATHPRLAEVPTKLLLQLLDESIPQINASSGADGTMTVFYIERIFKELGERADITPDEMALREFAYLPIFTRGKKPLTLHRLMVNNPEIFMSVVRAVYKPASGEPPEITPEAQRLATAAYELLGSLHVLPGQHDETVELEKLAKWCSDVRELAKEADRARITDLQIGHLLAHAPASSVDQAWPHESVRTVIEQLASDDVERGIAIERFNMRGVYSKAIGEGGQQERALAQQSRNWAAAAAAYPRTSALLTRIAEDWIHHAKEADIQAEKDALRR